MKDRQRSLNIIAILLAALVVAVVIWGCVHGADPLHMQVSDGIEQIDLDPVAWRSASRMSSSPVKMRPES